MIDRLHAFSDGVFAIAITLLVLELDVPDGLTEADLSGAFKDLAPQLFSFALSFLVIGRFWMSHLSVLRHVQSWDRRLLALNTLFLFSIVFLPFPTALLGEYIHYRSAMIVYAVSISVAGMLLAVLWTDLAYRSEPLTEELGPLVRRKFLLRLLSVPIVFLASVPVVLAGQRHVAAAMWIVVLPLIHFGGAFLGRFRRSHPRPA